MSRPTLLAQVVAALDRTTRLQHQLARRAAFLRGIATDLRLGGDVAVASARLLQHVRDSGMGLETIETKKFA